MKIGLHVGQQDCSFEELVRLWGMAEDLGFDWVSIWDHFLEVPYRDGRTPVYESVSTMAALAAKTSKVRVGCLVFCAGYRPPTVLAKMAATIDHVSGGRVTLGLGAGWNAEEYAAYGFHFPEAGVRLDILEESVQIVRAMFTQDQTTFLGKHFQVEAARCEPKPVQARLPLWIGGMGERRTLPMAARLADGWNASFISAAAFRRKNRIVDLACEAARRDPSEVERSINVGFYMAADRQGSQRARQAYRDLIDAAPYLEGGAIVGSPSEAVDQVAEFAEAGADTLTLGIRAPFDWDAVQAFAEEVKPAFD